ncbi:MAG: PorT family protein [Bacteroidales bacterium]|nr:PorT family protein [Bacteroidales bacterium]
MKKFLLAIAVMFCATTVASAQMQFRYGFKGGLNFATFSSDPDDIQARLGQWGVLCRFEFGSFAIQPEVFYSRQGVRSLEKVIFDHHKYGPAFATGDILETEYYKLGVLTDNIQMPIIAKYYLPFSGVLKGSNIQAGPQFSQRFDYKISSPSQKGYLADSRMGEREDINFIGKFNSLGRDMNQFTIAASFGFGYDSESGIGVDLRCNWGLTPVFKTLYNTNSTDRVYSVSFTYVF